MILLRKYNALLMKKGAKIWQKEKIAKEEF